ncbi:MAG: PIN domain-containing protein [Gaiellaceae bacterium]
MIVLDTSAALELLGDFELGTWVEDQLSAESVHAPHVMDIEIAGALRRLVREQRISRERAELALSGLVDLDVARHGHLPLLPRIWELRENLRASDAAFVALAEALAATLVTTDRRLARAAGIRAKVVAP